MLSRFVSDNDKAGVQSLVTYTGEKAFQQLLYKDQVLEADILSLLGILYQKEGDFFASEYEIAESLRIRRELNDSPKDLAIVACYNYLGVARDSDLRHDEGKEWLEKSFAIIKDRNEDLYIRLRCQNNLNRARNRYATDNFEEAEKLLDKALELARVFDGWYSLA